MASAWPPVSMPGQLSIQGYMPSGIITPATATGQVITITRVTGFCAGTCYPDGCEYGGPDGTRPDGTYGVNLHRLYVRWALYVRSPCSCLLGALLLIMLMHVWRVPLCAHAFPLSPTPHQKERKPGGVCCRPKVWGGTLPATVHP